MKLRLFLAVLFGSLLLGCARPPTYSATAEITIELQEMILVPPTEEALKEEDQAQIQNDLEVIASPDVLVPVIAKLNLNHIWAQRLKIGSEPLSDEQALKHLREALNLKAGPASQHTLTETALVDIKITASSDVPSEAADIANGIANRYKTMRDIEEKQKEDEGIKVLGDQISQQEKVVEEAQATAQKNPQDRPTQDRLKETQDLLDALNMKLKQDTAAAALSQSPVRIISLAGAPSQ